MTTIVASLVSVINTYYGDVGGGDKPPFIVDEIETRRTPYYESGIEHIVVGVRNPVTREPLDYDFADVDHELFAAISTPTSADRLKEIVDEVRLIINTKNSGNITAQFVSQEIPKSDRKAGIHAIELIATLEQCAIPSGASYDGFEGGAHLHNNGFEDRTTSTISFDAGTRTLTIAPIGLGSFIFWQNRIEYEIDEDMTKVVTDTSGTHVIYYDLGQLETTINPNHSEMDDIIENKVLVAIIYWNATDDDQYIFADERHGLRMSGVTHHYLHDIMGSQYQSGLTVSDYVLDDDSDAALTFEVSDGRFYDDDLEHEVESAVDASGQYEQILNGVDAEIPILYRDDVDGSWTQAAASTLPFLTTGSGRLAYNNDDGDGTFSQVEVTDNRWMGYTLVVTNDSELPVKMIQGQAEYTSVQSAIEEANAEILAFGDLPSPEMIVIYRFVMRTKSTFGGTKKAKIDDITDFRGNPITGQGAVATSHGTLSGLGDDDHGQYLNDARGDAKIATHTAIVDAHHDEDHIHPAPSHASTTGKTTDDHHAESHDLASHSTKAHSELTDVNTDDHHAAYTDADAKAACVSDAAYLDGDLWDGVADEAPSKNATRDELEAHYALANGHHPQSHTLASHSTKNHSELENLDQDDHHDKVHLLGSHSDFALSGPDVEDLEMVGVANRAWVSLGIANSVNGYRQLTGITQRDGDLDAQYILGIALLKGNYKLKIDGCKVTVSDADGGDYVDRIRVTHYKDGVGNDTFIDDGTNRTAPGEYTYAVAAEDVSGSQTVGVFLEGTYANDDDLDVTDVSLRCYYEK